MECYQCIDRTIKSNDPEINSDIHTNLYVKKKKHTSIINDKEMVIQSNGVRKKWVGSWGEISI